MKQASKKAATKSKSAVSRSTNSKKLVTGSKKRVALTSGQKKFGIILSIVVLVVGVVTAYSLYQNNSVNAASCKSKVLNVGSSSVCTEYFLKVAKARGTNKYTENGKTITVAPGTMFGPKVSKVAKANGLGTSISGNDWKTICKWAGDKRLSTTFTNMGCRGILKLSDLTNKARCETTGKHWWSKVGSVPAHCSDNKQPKREMRAALSIKDQPTCRSYNYDWIPAKYDHAAFCVKNKPSASSLKTEAGCKMYNYSWIGATNFSKADCY